MVMTDNSILWLHRFGSGLSQPAHSHMKIAQNWFCSLSMVVSGAHPHWPNCLVYFGTSLGMQVPVPNTRHGYINLQDLSKLEHVFLSIRQIVCPPDWYTFWSSSHYNGWFNLTWTDITDISTAAVDKGLKQRFGCWDDLTGNHCMKSGSCGFI